MPEQRKFNILVLDTKKNNPNHYIVLSIIAELRKLARVSRVDKVDYSTAVRSAQLLQYDVLIALDGEAINIDVLARLKPLVGASVLWAWEDPYERRRTVALASLFDYIFTNDPDSVDFYPSSAAYLPLAATERRSVRKRDADYDYDLSFVGSAWPNRVAFLRRLLREAPDLKTRIVLSYNPHLPKAYLDLPESDYVGSLSHSDFLGVINRSRINLTLHRDFSGDGLTPKAAGPGPRLFEAALAGGFQLVDAADTLIDGFYSAKMVETFLGFEDCLDKIRSALANPARRIEMAQAAQSHTAAHHTYGRRIEAIFDRLESTPRPTCIQVEEKKKPRLLFVTHNTISGGNFGGVEVYQETITQELREKYEIFYYRPAQPAVSSGRRHYVLTSDRHNVLYRNNVPEFDIWTTLTDPDSEREFAKILSEYQIDLVHFHHLINHVASLPIISKMLGVPSVYTLQDFWATCTRFNLLDHRGLYCAIAERPKTACDICLRSSENKVEGSQAYRRSFFSRVLLSYDRIMGNSPSAMAICQGVYPELPVEKFVPIGLPLPWSVPRAQAEPSEANGKASPLKVVFLGNFTKVKGAEAFLELANQVRDDNITFTICGRIDEPFPEILRKENFPNVIVQGGFEPGELDLGAFDVSLHLSIWPETYCITLSEAWKANVVPIVTGCGALSDRVTDGVNGYQVPIGGSGELVDLLRRLQGNRRELDDIRRNIGSHLWLTPQQHCVTLEGVYKELMSAFPQPARPKAPEIDTGAPCNLALTGRRALAANWARPGDLAIHHMPDPEFKPLSPLRTSLGPVRAALAGGRIENATLIKWHLDSIDLRSIDDFSDPDPWADLPASFQLSGWLEYRQGVSDRTMLAVRSLNGDLILRPVHLYDRPELWRAGESTPTGTGFMTDLFPKQMLVEGLYGLELMHLDDDGLLSVDALPATLLVRSNSARLAFSRRPLARTPLPGLAWPAEPRIEARALRQTVDEIAVVDTVPEGESPAHLLKIRGWMLDLEGDGGATALQLVGDAGEHHVALTPAPRADVAAFFDMTSATDSGFEGGLWLLGVPAGTYRIQLVRSQSRGVFIHDVGVLVLEAATARVMRQEDIVLSEPLLDALLSDQMEA